MPDIINCDIWMRTCMMENKRQGFSSMYTNSEANYQFQLIRKCKWLKTVLQYHIGLPDYIFDYYKLIEYKWNYIGNYSSQYQSLL